MQENIKSYNSIYQLRQAFIRSGGHSDTFAADFNRLETPANMYFRLFFHFNTGHGLLNTGDVFVDPDPTRTGYTTDTNTALSYLFTNGEMQRKQMLDDFVSLLSNINTYSPWYFQSIEGLQEALQRSEYTGEFKVDEEPKSIVIKTLEDAYDNRISTMLDLYKAVAFSKVQHKEILPANLRRFDMSIYIINTPLAYVHYGFKSKFDKTDAGLDGLPGVNLSDRNHTDVVFDIPGYHEWATGSSNIFASAKLIELQGCEIDANSASSAYAEVKSDEPFQMKHDIKITFKNIVEQRFNDSLNRIIGDYIFMDMDRADRESKDNVWGSGEEQLSDEQIAAAAPNRNLQDNINNMTFGESVWHWFDEDNPDNIEGDEQYGWYEISVPESPENISMDDTIRTMESEREAAQNAYTEGISGKVTGASSAIDPAMTEKNEVMAERYGDEAIFENFGKGANKPVPGGSKNITDKYAPDLIGKVTGDFLKGVTGTAKSYAESMLARVTMGNLYWGSLSNPQATINPYKWGSNLTQIGLDRTVGKQMQKGLGSIKSTLDNAKAAARGWVMGSSIGTNLHDHPNHPAHETFGHRP